MGNKLWIRLLNERLVVNSQPLSIEKPDFTENLTWYAYAIEPTWGKYDGCKELNELIARLKSLAQDPLHKDVSVSFEIPKPGKPTFMYVSVESSLLAELQSLLYGGDENENLRLAFEAKANGVSVRVPCKPCLKPKSCSTGTGQFATFHIRYEMSDIRIPDGFLIPEDPSENDWIVKVSLFVEVDQQDCFPAVGLTHQVLSFNRRLLRDKSTCDLFVFSRDNSVVKCHSLFVGSMSSLLRQQIKKVGPAPGATEEKQNRLTLPELSELGLQAFVEYAYYHGLTKPKRRIKLAFELLEVALKYRIPPLEAVMIQLIMSRDADALAINDVLYFYVFLKQKDGLKPLKTKIIGVITAKKGELFKSALNKDKNFDKEVYMELKAMFPNDQDLYMKVEVEKLSKLLGKPALI